MEAQVFPYHFPDGKNGFNDTRTSKLGLSRYFNARLFCADPRFAADAQYIFYAQYVTELTQVTSSISIAMRKGSQQEQVTAQMLTDPDNRKQILTSDRGFRFLQTIRGTPAYWERTLKDLYAMLRQLGTPTWF